MPKPRTLIALASAFALVAAVVLRIVGQKQASIDPAHGSREAFAGHGIPDDVCGNVLDYVTQGLSDPPLSVTCTDFSDEEVRLSRRHELISSQQRIPTTPSRRTRTSAPLHRLEANPSHSVLSLASATGLACSPATTRQSKRHHWSRHHWSIASGEFLRAVATSALSLLADISSRRVELRLGRSATPLRFSTLRLHNPSVEVQSLACR